VSSADLKALRLALDDAIAREVSPEAIGLVLTQHGLTVADIRSHVPINVSSSTVDAIRRNLSVCSSIWPPLPMTSPLDL
jgi:hypothetical protein